MTYGNNPGNGRTSPFGDGNGNTKEAPMAGTDLIANPKGPDSPGRDKPIDVLNPKRSTPDKRTPSPSSVMQGGNTAAEVYSPGQARGGVGSVGNNAKPFKFSGA
jgi:hypothetical protein